MLLTALSWGSGASADDISKTLDTFKDQNPAPSSNAPADAPFERSVSVSYSSVTYYLVKDQSFDAPNNVSVDLYGLDLSTNRYFSDSLGVELGIYQGRTSSLTLGGGSNQNIVSLSSMTNMRSVSTYGARASLIFGYNLRTPGFNIHVGIGLYGERTTIDRVNAASTTETLTGNSFRFGLGYGWDTVRLDLWADSRSRHPQGFVETAATGLRLTYLY